MALQFFRKHKKYFFVLMVAAVLAMVTFGVLDELGNVWYRIFGSKEEKVVVMEVYGQPVTRREVWDIRTNLSRAGAFHDLAQQYIQSMQQMNRPQEEVAARGRALAKYISGIAMFYNDRRGGASEERQTKFLQVAVVLMREAARNGISASDDAAQNHFESWAKAGIDPWFIDMIMSQAFRGSKREMLDTLRQEMVLKTYMTSMEDLPKTLTDDVIQAFLMRNDTIKIQSVSLNPSDYLSGVAEPTEAQIAQQYDKYKDKLADPAAADGFGYKVPDRVKVKYIAALVSDAEKLAPPSEQELRDFYEKNKDTYYRMTEEEQAPIPGIQKMPGLIPAPKPASAASSAASAESAASAVSATSAATAATAATAAAKTDSVPAARTDEKAQDGGGTVTAMSATKVIHTGPGASAAASAATASVVPAAVPVAAPAVAPAGAVTTPEVKPVRYKSFEQSRSDVMSRVRSEKARRMVSEKIQKAYDDLSHSPQLALENVIDGVYLKVHATSKSLTREQLQKLPGLGESSKVDETQSRGGAPFAALALSVKPLDAESDVVLNQPVGVLRDNLGDAFIFVVTEAEKAHAPAGLADVRDLVVRDLKLAEAAKKAETLADELVAAAKEQGLAEVAKARKLKMEDKADSMTRGEGEEQKFMGRSFPGNPLAKAAFATVDKNLKVGKLVPPTHNEPVEVFQIIEHTEGTREAYATQRENLTRGAISMTASKFFYQAMEKPEIIIKRAGLKEMAPLDPARQAIQSDDPDQQPQGL